MSACGVRGAGAMYHSAASRTLDPVVSVASRAIVVAIAVQQWPGSAYPPSSRSPPRYTPVARHRTGSSSNADDWHVPREPSDQGRTRRDLGRRGVGGAYTIT